MIYQMVLHGGLYSLFLLHVAKYHFAYFLIRPCNLTYMAAIEAAINCQLENMPGVPEVNRLGVVFHN
jgi:hypothetical protein